MPPVKRQPLLPKCSCAFDSSTKREKSKEDFKKCPEKSGRKNSGHAAVFRKKKGVEEALFSFLNL